MAGYNTSPYNVEEYNAGTIVSIGGGGSTTPAARSERARIVTVPFRPLIPPGIAIFVPHVGERRTEGVPPVVAPGGISVTPPRGSACVVGVMPPFVRSVRVPGIASVHAEGLTPKAVNIWEREDEALLMGLDLEEFMD